MAFNLAPYILRQMIDVVNGAAPELKVQVPGFTNMLIRNRSEQPFQISSAPFNGTKRELRVGYGHRITPADVSRSAVDCLHTTKPTEFETTVSVANVVWHSVALGDELVAQYQDEAGQQTSVDGLGPVSRKMLQIIFREANGLLNALDQDLLTLAAAAIGKNRANGLTTAKTININKDGSVNLLTDGFTEIFKDYALNEFQAGIPAIVGSGLMLNFMQQVDRNALSFNQAGFNPGAMFRGQADWYYDQNAATILGTNQIIVYEPGAVQLVEYFQYTGPKAGRFPGDSSFGVIYLPVQTINGIEKVGFDFQLRYVPCVETQTDGYSGAPITVDKGWQLILSKQFGLFTIPTDAYKFYDELTGNRGSLRYVLTNTCDAC